MKKKKGGRPRRRKFLCVEPGGANLKDEQFTLYANNYEHARELASIWNASVIKEVI